jgi:hypothetical protein
MRSSQPHQYFIYYHETSTAFPTHPVLRGESHAINPSESKPDVLAKVVWAEAEADLPSRYRDEIPDVLTVISFGRVVWMVEKSGAEMNEILPGTHGMSLPDS